MDLLVITSYPQKGSTHGAGTVGVASYTKNTLLAMKRLKIKVLAEKFKDDKQYKEGGIEVRRVWRRGDIFLFWNLLREVLKERRTRKIMIAFEHAMFGNYLMLAAFPLFLFVLKILKKDVILVMHQVIYDINELYGHIGLEYASTKADIINLIIKVYYRTIFGLVNKIVVFEEIFKEKLAEFTDRKKITVIPHGVENVNVREVKKSNDEFVILYFGFIAWYKGVDWIVDKVKSQKSKVKSKVKLVIAGGENPNHRDKKFYMDYVKKIEEIAKLSNDQIVATGFVEERDISKYFSACDLVVLPYRTLMSSSGPLSLALSYGKPFLMSESMQDIGNTSDFQQAFVESKLGIEDLTFSLTDHSFDKKIKELNEDRSKLQQIAKFAEILKEKRKFEAIGERFRKLC